MNRRRVVTEPDLAQLPTIRAALTKGREVAKRLHIPPGDVDRAEFMIAAVALEVTGQAAPLGPPAH